MKIRIAVPSKGRISDPSVAILEKAGLKIEDPTNRRLFSKTNHENIEVMFVRAADIGSYVEDGVVDMGISGLDLISEANVQVEILSDLNFGKTSLVIASPEDCKIDSIGDINTNMTIATEFPNLTKEYLRSHGLDLKIHRLSGSTEIAPHIGVADLISDLTSTGETLKKNHLKIIDKILDSSIMLITNKNSYLKKKEIIDSVKISIDGVIEAENKRLLIMNLNKNDLSKIKDILPSMAGPTVSEVLAKDETLAIQVIVDENRVFELVNKLKNAGARDILVVQVERIIN
ncbi:MAG: ATP phosphoribosyltransferase [Methanobrevibacter sp.]|jgi:ATP phosphoribosyltransferase|nr:ATP phosphoribosyltransferase [Candidatus Methanovirga aequatorialis]